MGMTASKIKASIRALQAQIADLNRVISDLERDERIRHQQWLERERQRAHRSRRFSLYFPAGLDHRIKLADLCIQLRRMTTKYELLACLRGLLKSVEHRLLTMLRALCHAVLPLDMVVVQKTWFLNHGERPPKPLTSAIPV